MPAVSCGCLQQHHSVHHGHRQGHGQPADRLCRPPACGMCAPPLPPLHRAPRRPQGKSRPGGPEGAPTWAPFWRSSSTWLTALPSIPVPRTMPGSSLRCPVPLRNKVCFLKICPASFGGSGLIMVCRPALVAHGNTSSMTRPLSKYCEGLAMGRGPGVPKLTVVHGS